MYNLSQLSSSEKKSQSSINIYFSSHPDDFDKFSEIIIKYLHTHSDSDWILWYRNSSEADNCNENNSDDLLEKMNLFIIPVTYKLLTEKSLTIDDDLEFALKHNISVLPVLFESIPSQLYKKVFNSIQYLKVHSSDLTEISFDDKLKKFLSAILFDKKTIKKINSAFDTRIFLSYRKKDRKFAQEIMHIIHENPLCRDFAIWYDEFLTPGEDFNAELKKMINRCDLFALVVTPNLLERPNYVIEKEYPVAKGIKPIIATEAVQTDRKQFDEIFNSCSDYFNILERGKLWDAILTLLNKPDVSTKVSSAEHEFFIGLAYLSGINVEKNCQRALSLIESAANRGFADSAKKLAQMYLYGDGCIRNFKKVIYWQKKYISLLKKQQLKGKRETENMLCICESQLELGDFYKNLLGDRHSLEKATKSYSDAMIICEHLLSTKKDDSALMSLLSNIYIKLGDIGADSRCYYQKAFYLRKALVEALNSTRSKRDFVLINIRMGDASKKDEAYKYYKSALKLANQIIDLDVSVEMQRVFALIHYKLGKLYINQEVPDVSKAEKYFLKYRKIQKSIVGATNSNNDKKFLAVSYQSLGMLYFKFTQLRQKAKKNLVCCAKIRDSLLIDVATPEAIEDSMRAYMNLGLFYLNNDSDLALLNFEKALKIIKGLPKASRTEKTYFHIAKLYKQIWELTKARKALILAIKATGILCKIAPNNDDYKIMYDALKNKINE